METPDYLKPPRAPRLFTSKQTNSSPQFTLCVEVFSSGASDRSTILGTHQEAKSGQDALDSTEPPAMGQTVAAYFEHSDWKEAPGLYNQDYQPAMNVGEQRNWQLTVYTDKPNTDMTVSWGKSLRQVPADIMLSFRKVGETQWQDMRQVSKVEFTSGTRITELEFEIQAERIEKANPIPAAGNTRLLPCYPNPFSAEICIPYELAQDSEVEIKIYNIAGELVRTLNVGMKSAGSYVTNSTAAYWNGCNDEVEKVASGIYFCVFKAGNVTAVRKIGVCR
ncbi:hypothetical protein COZ71_08090 [Candidatus Desantisbacteria bacterium CG_4_8_14_3_um_filter_40_12]|uniref:Secretion system C-terminal sorting domain-containing protein n=2 Tax=unclassified Candidatus Desantisiibacteriota TaxID=3106372 RepID=A0A2M7JA70_9BACT|nr:MAG: hypothetical protein COZ71_08090 [Candidatus Desantisbacteria bacterium CG_4_8_14_3_um_filter_40_12]PIY18992.1 MAG: hypothetical protein COZ13_07680 [Candidatus Desantisbacteria bacterium CG_4_10_14_3_um_filter_40_18]